METKRTQVILEIAGKQLLLGEIVAVTDDVAAVDTSSHCTVTLGFVAEPDAFAKMRAAIAEPPTTQPHYTQLPTFKRANKRRFVK